MRRHELTDEEWATLEPLLPPSRPATGRPNKNHRTLLNGILWNEMGPKQYDREAYRERTIVERTINRLKR